MKEDKRHDKDLDQSSADQDQLRSNTTNETIREASGDPDMDLNEMKETDRGTDSTYDRTSQETHDRTSLNQGMSWSPNDASAVRSGGTTDMDNQTASGAGLNTGRRSGTGSGLEPKTGVTGSDFDGQNATS